MWHLKENVEENEDISVAVGGFIFLTSHILKEKKKKRYFRVSQCWVKEIYIHMTVVHLQNGDGEKKLDHDMFWLKYSSKL